MKNLIKYVFILKICFSFAQNKITISQALNIASKQSMLCERLAKDKVFKITNPNNQNTEQKLGVSLIQFEQNISILNEMDLPNDIHSKITTVEMLWIGYKKNILDKNHSSAIKTMEFNNVMLNNCNDVFKSILTLSEIKNAYPYNSNDIIFPDAYKASNDLKHLTQKISLHYNAYFSKVIAYQPDAFDNIISKINTSIDTIDKFESNDTEIKGKTTLIKKQWNDLKSIIEHVALTKFTTTDNYPKPDYVINESNKILKNVDLLTRLYKAKSDIN